VNEMWLNIGGMILTGESRYTQRETCPSAGLHTQNPIWSGVGSNQGSAQPRAGLGPGKKNRAPNKSGPAKNLNTISEILTVICIVNWAWSERVNLYNRQ
jgi:hypothetical protein